jgi:vitamin B12 transporter
MRFSVRVLFLRYFVVFLSLFSFAHVTAAQNPATGKLSGTVADPRGASVAGAQISAAPIPPSGPSSWEPIRGSSASDGTFSLTLSPGRYRFTISRDSFMPVIEEISIAAGETRELQVRLALEPLSSKVVVTAQTLPLEAESSPAPATILTREEIEQRGATSFPDLLATLPGFSLGRTGAEGGSTSLFLDGGNSNYTKVLVDGAPINTPGGLIDFSNFTLDNIDKIEVIHGAESALYGSDAMDGVIQIFTHRGTTRIPEFTAFADGGNFGTGRGGAQLSGLLGRFDYSSGVSDMETNGQGQNDAFRDRTLSGNFGWRFSETARASLSLRDSVSDAGTPGPTALGKGTDLTDSILLHNFTAGLHTEFTTGSHWHHQLNGTEFYFRELNITPAYGNSLYQYNRSRFAEQSTYLIHSFAITAGYEYEVENGFTTSIALHARRNNQAGFLDAQWQPISRLTLSAGGREEDNATYGTRFVPRVGASYALRIARGALGDTRLRASYGKGIVEPRFDQTYGLDSCYPGNPNLYPEQSRTTQAGVEQKLASDRVRLTADYFDSRFHNIISFISGPNTMACLYGTGTFFNTNLASARGANFSGEARITHWLSGSANYTYDSTRTISAPTDPTNLDPNYLPGSRLLRRPVNSGNAMLNAFFLHMNWNLSGYFTGLRYDYNYPGQIINPGYARFDLAASYNASHGFSIYGRIANLADKKYQEAYGYPALGREFRIGVKYTTRHE